MVPQVGERTQDTHPKPARRYDHPRVPAEGHQLAVDLAGECAGQLKRVAFTATEQALPSERRRSDVDYSHAVCLLDHSW
jgi:hypothetical protein